MGRKQIKINTLLKILFQWITKEWSSVSVIFDIGHVYCIGHVRYEFVSSFLRKMKIPVLYIYMAILYNI